MYQIMSYITFLIKCLTVCALLQSAAFAAMYKWIDEEGRTHYTQNPPPENTESKVIKPPPTVDTGGANKTLRTQNEKADALMEDRHKAAEVKRKEEEKSAEVQAYCDKLKEQLNVYNRPRVRVAEEEGGTASHITEEQRLASIDKIKKNMKQTCN